MGLMLSGLLVAAIVGVVLLGNRRAQDGRPLPGLRWVGGAAAGVIAVIGGLIAVFLLTRGVVQALDLSRDTVPLAVGAIWIAFAVVGFGLTRAAKRR